MKYNVTLYLSCRVKLEDIEAASQAEAVKAATEKFDPAEFFIGDDARESPAWDEGPILGALVDEEGDDEYLRSRYHAGEGAPIYLNSDPAEEPAT